MVKLIINDKILTLKSFKLFVVVVCCVFFFSCVRVLFVVCLCLCLCWCACAWVSFKAHLFISFILLCRAQSNVSSHFLSLLVLVLVPLPLPPSPSPSLLLLLTLFFSLLFISFSTWWRFMLFWVYVFEKINV